MKVQSPPVAAILRSPLATADLFEEEDRSHHEREDHRSHLHVSPRTQHISAHAGATAVPRRPESRVESAQRGTNARGRRASAVACRSPGTRSGTLVPRDVDVAGTTVPYVDAGSLVRQEVVTCVASRSARHGCCSWPTPCCLRKLARAVDPPAVTERCVSCVRDARTRGSTSAPVDQLGGPRSALSSSVRTTVPTSTLLSSRAERFSARCCAARSSRRSAQRAFRSPGAAIGMPGAPP